MGNNINLNTNPVSREVGTLCDTESYPHRLNAVTVAKSVSTKY